MTPGPDSLEQAILQALAQLPEGSGMSLPRLGKQLGQSASVLMRCLATMGSAALGGTTGPGWVEVQQQDGHWRVTLTPAGRRQA
jgi:FdhD protein